MTQWWPEKRLNHCSGIRASMQTFAEEYHRNPGRDYVARLWLILLMKYEDAFEPAKKQFHGNGSFGNGADMRAGPIPLVGHNLSDTDLAKLTVLT